MESQKDQIWERRKVNQKLGFARFLVGDLVGKIVEMRACPECMWAGSKQRLVKQRSIRLSQKLMMGLRGHILVFHSHALRFGV